jgi:hypothetical protein
VCVGGACGSCTTTAYERPQAAASSGSDAQWYCPGTGLTPCTSTLLYNYVHVDDGAAAGCDLSTGADLTSQPIEVTGFFTSATVPSGAFIQGVTVQVWRYESGTCSVVDDAVELLKDGAQFGSNNKAATTTCWPQGAPAQAATYGCPTCTWGVTGGISYADVTDSTFGVRLVVQNYTPAYTPTAYVDAISMAVTYCR